MNKLDDWIWKLWNFYWKFRRYTRIVSITNLKRSYYNHFNQILWIIRDLYCKLMSYKVMKNREKFENFAWNPAGSTRLPGEFHQKITIFILIRTHEQTNTAKFAVPGILLQKMKTRKYDFTYNSSYFWSQFLILSYNYVKNPAAVLHFYEKFSRKRENSRCVFGLFNR